MNKAQASKATGGIGYASKPQCPTYGLPALASCPTGAKLARTVGSVCSRCYARRGRYTLPSVVAAQRRRFCAVKRLGDQSAREVWVDAMAWLISGHEWFVWHDSGDIVSPAYLDAILEVCDRTPGTRHWIRTREAEMVANHLASPNVYKPGGNAVIRVSAPMVDRRGGWPPRYKPRHVAYVGTRPLPGSFACPATFGDAPGCTSCRRCWDSDLTAVTYRLH